jgi:ribonuclease HI
MNKVVEIYTDGACRGNPGQGGWGVVLYYDGHEKRLYGADPLTTNNKMELTAAIEALAALKRSCVVKLTTDSEYVKKGITEWLPAWRKRGWRRSNKHKIKNLELWQRLDQEASRHQIQWNWVKGHAGHPGNELADRLANQAIDELST